MLCISPQNQYHIASIQVKWGKPAIFQKKKNTFNRWKKIEETSRRASEEESLSSRPTDTQQMSHVQLDKITAYILEYLTEYQEQVII